MHDKALAIGEEAEKESFLIAEIHKDVTNADCEMLKQRDDINKIMNPSSNNESEKKSDKKSGKSKDIVLSDYEYDVAATEYDDTDTGLNGKRS